jgi:hypothetical protein
MPIESAQLLLDGNFAIKLIVISLSISTRNCTVEIFQQTDSHMLWQPQTTHHTFCNLQKMT